jgi:hypothetical protein
MQTKHLIGILALGLRALTSLLVLACLFASGVRVAASTPSTQLAQETMPDGLMGALLAASAQPFEAGAAGYSYVEQKVIASDGAANDFFGFSVALNGDMALVGAPAAEVRGAAYVFTRSGMTWSLQQKLTVSDGAGFGASVALSGGTALVGAPAGGGPGSAYIFTRIGTTWGQRDKLTAADGAADDAFGFSVALDGSTILVGAYRDDVGANADQGSAYVFMPGSGLLNWEQQAQLTALGGAAGDNFGFSVALDGDTALVGAPMDDVGANANQGSAYVFTGSGATWTQQAQLTAADGPGFGFSVALDGSTALVGVPFQGLAYIFRRIGAIWIQMDKLTASDGAEDDFFGWSVALSGDTDLVGAAYDDVGANSDQGSAYVFTPGGGLWNWERQAQLTAADGAVGDQFGLSVALSGNTGLVGAPMDDVGANAAQGSAYFYELSYAIYLPLVIRQ